MKMKIYSVVMVFAFAAAHAQTSKNVNANTNLSNLTMPTQVNVNLNPDVTDSLTLGSKAFRWKSLYADNIIFSDKSTQATAFIPYTAGSGINISNNKISYSGTMSQWITSNMNIYYNAGNVGIGTSSPAYKLDVKGDFNLNSGSVMRINSNKVFKDDAPNQNLFVGNNADDSLNGGYNNTAVGALSLLHNTNGNYNTAVGANSLIANTGGASNTAVGEKASYSNTTGYYNVAFGSGALYKNATASDNTAIGLQSLYNNTSGDNTAIGYKAAYSNTTALYTTAIGDQSLYANTTGAGNTALGYKAAFSNTNGASNTALGDQALELNTSGAYNTATGTLSLLNNTSGFNNTGIGTDALNANTTGAYNTAVGCTALLSNTGSSNTAVGEKAMQNSTTGGDNSAFGSGALQNNAGGNYNTSIGFQSLFNNTTGADYNTAVGYEAGYNNTTGDLNLFMGEQAGYANTTGSFNSYGGYHAGSANTTGSFNTYYGYAAGISNTDGTENTFLGYQAGLYSTGSNNTFVGYETTTSDGSYSNSSAVGSGTSIVDQAVVCLGNAALQAVESYAQYFTFSDGRYKKNIKENVVGLEFINKLRPVTYTLDVTGINNVLGVDQKLFTGNNLVANKEKNIYTGFIAQEVETAANSIGYNFSGVKKPGGNKSFYALSYSDFVVPLVKSVQQLSVQNDSLKNQNATQQNAINSLQTSVANLQKEIDDLRTNILTSSSTQTISSQNVELDGNVSTIAQNVPNPFSQSTVISYYLPDQINKAQINFYSQQGVLLKSIPVSSKGKGNINVKMNELPAGIYEYSLLIDGKLIDTKKMVLAK